MALNALRPSERDERVTRLKADVTDTKAAAGEPVKRKRIGIDIDIDMYRSLRVYAAKEGRTVNDIVREHLRELLSK